MIKNIFFDFNGTILDDTNLTYSIEAEMLEKEGLPPVSLEFYLDNFGFPVKDYYKKVGFDLSGNNFEILSNYFFSEYTKREAKETKLHDGIEEILIKLKKSGYKVYILSASEEKLLVNQLKALGIESYFDGFAASNNIEALGKIGYGRKFILDHNINTNESIMIGDTLHDYEVAKELNLMPVLFSKGHNSKKLLSETGAKIFDSFEEFYDFLENNNSK